MRYTQWMDWYRKHARTLPWRSEPTPYRVWVSEIMLQQTQVRTMLPYFERWIERFPTVEALADASEEEVVRAWAGLGYYSRARNLLRAAQVVVRERAGVFPTDREGWEALPGVGPYTAGAILSIAFGRTEAIVDGNVERVVCRVRAWADRVERKREIWGYAAQWVAEAVEQGFKPGDFNQALMELGARVCTVKRPDCMRCPIQEDCGAFRSGRPERYPEPKKRAEVVALEELRVLWIAENGEVLLRENLEGEWRAGLWDLPTLDGPAAVRRRGVQDLGEIRTKHVVTRHRIERITRILRVKKGFRVSKGFRWVEMEGLLEKEGATVGLSASARKTLVEAQRFLPQRLAQSSLNFASRLSAASGVSSFKLVR